TNYAYEKLLRNLSLNPDLSARVTPVQSFLSESTEGINEIQAYSSWKIDGSATDIHPLHGGVAPPSEFVEVITLDEFCRSRGIERVDFIKIDTDGNELSVLRGARQTIANNLPCVIFEAGLYLIEQANRFDEYFDYFDGLGYS